MTGKRWCLIAFALLVLLAAGIVALVYVVDPFELYHRAWFYSPPYASGTQSYSNAGVAHSFTYDSVIIGSSVTENCTPSVYDAALGGRFVKLCMNGGTSGDHARMMDAAFATHAVRRVVYGLDLFAYSQYFNNLKAPLPEYLYDQRLLTDTAYWFNRDVLFTHIPAALARLGATTEDEARDRMYHWSPPQMPGADALAAMVDCTAPLPEQPVSERMTFFAENCVTHNLIAYARAHPQTVFDVFFPPYSLLYWANEARTGALETRLAQKRCVIRALLDEPNVRLHDFQTRMDWVTDGELYYDLIHYTDRVNDAMAAAIADGSARVTTLAQADANADALRAAVYACFP